GHVYVDSNNNGIREAGEPAIANAIVTLTGINDLGVAIQLTQQTAVDGAYFFSNLRPGTYTITETQPSGYLDGKDTIGSQGGVTSNDHFSSIALQQGVNGVNNDFGELPLVSIEISPPPTQPPPPPPTSKWYYFSGMYY